MYRFYGSEGDGAVCMVLGVLRVSRFEFFPCYLFRYSRRMCHEKCVVWSCYNNISRHFGRKLRCLCFLITQCTFDDG